jgi:hypothetical protein
MGVNTLGGPLDFVAAIDTDQLEGQLKAGFDVLTARVDDLNQSLGKTGSVLLSSFDPASVQKFTGIVDTATEKIGNLLRKGLEGIDSKKLEQLGTDIGNATTEFGRLDTILKFIKENVGNLKLNPEEIDQLTSAVGALQAGFDGLTEKQKTALTQLRNLKDQLATKGAGDPGFAENFKKASELEKKLKDVNNQLKLSSQHAPGIQAATQAFRGLIGGFEAVAGAAALFSDNNEEAEKTIKTLIATMGILQGVEEVMAVVEKDSALNVFLQSQYRKLSAVAADEQAVATEGLAVAEGAEAVAAESAAVATEELNAAMLANPAGILLATLAAVVIAMQAFASRAEEATKEQLQFNKAAAEANEVLAKLAELQVRGRKQATTEAQNAVTLAQAQNKSEQEIADLKLEALRTERDENTVRLATLGMDEESIKFHEARLEILLEEQESLIRVGESGKELTEFQKNRLENLQSLIKGVQALLEPAEKARERNKQIDAQTNAERAEANRQATENALKSAQAEAEGRLLLAKKNTKEELDLRIAAIRVRTKAELFGLQNPEHAGERKKALDQEIKDIQDAERNFRIVQLNNEKSVIEARLAAVKIGSS